MSVRLDYCNSPKATENFLERFSTSFQTFTLQVLIFAGTKFHDLREFQKDHEFKYSFHRTFLASVKFNTRTFKHIYFSKFDFQVIPVLSKVALIFTNKFKTFPKRIKRFRLIKGFIKFCMPHFGVKYRCSDCKQKI